VIQPVRKTKWKLAPALLLAVGTLSASQIPARAEGELTAEIFQQLYQQIRPQPGESRWLEVPWQIDLHAARQKAAAEGKPLFVMSGGGATAIGPC
jgi:hypothetical protein